MEKNKTARYFKYAIGEIVLVVIGILIALQINNYNDRQNQDGIERTAIYNLKVDFLFNQNALRNNIKKLINGRKNSFIILNNTGNKYQNGFDIDTILQNASVIAKYYPQNGFLLDLINSGKLGIIKNDILRNKISSWLPTLETLKDMEKLALANNQDYVKYIIKNGSWLNVDEKINDSFIAELNFPKSGFEIDNNEMLKNIEFENMTENLIINKSGLLNRYEKLLELNDEIINLLETEINK
tara:strand:+ start:2240 stop:2962 length:723 start_codon:yes stop_codon:yes gene_type:complete